MIRGDKSVDPYDALYRDFRWRVPAHFNLADVCCARWAAKTPDATAIRYEREDGSRADLSYAELQREANRLSHALERIGVRAGDRVAVVMPQRPQTAIANIALYQLGAVAMPLSMLFGPDALEYRLQNSEARVAIVDETGIANLRAARPACPALEAVIAVDAARGQGDLDWSAALARESAAYTARATRADDPAVLIYTSGTTGPPKGALIAHRGLIGNLSGFVCSQNWFPQDDAVFWSPADWAWTGGLMDALLPSLYFGRTIIACQGRFAPEKAFELMQRHRVTHTFLFPTALKAMMKAVPAPRERYKLALRAIMSAGEAVG
ncbi:AMP-binding protein, partial [Piscinibacter sp.]|uniref:AMP-binding protein n=1 Tax=Piscinibacter sp. TaxID=1903157 RepID=UPI002F415B7E